MTWCNAMKVPFAQVNFYIENVGHSIILKLKESILLLPKLGLCTESLVKMISVPGFLMETG